MFQVNTNQTRKDLIEGLKQFEISFSVDEGFFVFPEHNLRAQVVGLDVVRLDWLDSDQDVVGQQLVSIDQLIINL